MKKSFALAAALVSIAVVSVTAGQALATSQKTAKAPSKVMIVMHDPGCHWFSMGGKFKTKATVTAPAKVTNVDEATLIVKGAGTTKRIPVGKQLILGHGTYTITMVKQAPDDNHLKLTVK